MKRFLIFLSVFFLMCSVLPLSVYAADEMYYYEFYLHSDWPGNKYQSYSEINGYIGVKKGLMPALAISDDTGTVRQFRIVLVDSQGVIHSYVSENAYGSLGSWWNGETRTYQDENCIYSITMSNDSSYAMSGLYASVGNYRTNLQVLEIDDFSFYQSSATVPEDAGKVPNPIFDMWKWDDLKVILRSSYSHVLTNYAAGMTVTFYDDAGNLRDDYLGPNSATVAGSSVNPIKVNNLDGNLTISLSIQDFVTYCKEIYDCDGVQIVTVKSVCQNVMNDKLSNVIYSTYDIASNTVTDSYLDNASGQVISGNVSDAGYSDVIPQYYYQYGAVQEEMTVNDIWDFLNKGIKSITLSFVSIANMLTTMLNTTVSFASSIGKITTALMGTMLGNIISGSFVAVILIRFLGR